MEASRVSVVRAVFVVKSGMMSAMSCISVDLIIDKTVEHFI